MTTAPTSTVYGPVQSWRVGRSLGIDLLFSSSICSFRCVYCQLGKIETPTRERGIWVTTERLLADLAASDWQSADIITFSGSGEPTLALNLGEAIRAVKAFTGKPVMVLTNATMLEDPAVRADLRDADKVFCKLDAADEKTLRLIDRPVDGITLAGIIRGIEALRADYPGYLAIQSMFLAVNKKSTTDFAAILNRIKPDEVQLNTPLRPVPRGWFLGARGNHVPDDAPYEMVDLVHLSREEALKLEADLRALTGLKIVSIFNNELAANG